MPSWLVRGILNQIVWGSRFKLEPLVTIMSAIILHNEIIHYEVLGRGRPLLFLHDWIGSWRYWMPTMQTASLSYRAYGLDMWGYGDTAKNPDYYPLEQQTSLLAAFVNAMGIGKIALIGHGLGAVVALLYTLRHPDFVDRVFIVGYPLHKGAINDRLRSANPVDLAEWLLARSPDTEAARAEVPKCDPIAITISLDSLLSLDLESLPNRAQNPILLVHGRYDPAIETPNLEEVFRWNENTHYIIFEQSGHFPMLDEPSKFNRLLTDFLSLNSGASPRQLQLKEEWKRRVR